MAKPGKFNTLKKNKLIEALEEGSTIKGACADQEISTQTFYYHYGDDEDFTERVDTAKHKADDRVVKSLYQSAIDGNFPAQKYWLTNRDPENWGEKNEKDDGKDLEEVVSAIMKSAEASKDE